MKRFTVLMCCLYIWGCSSGINLTVPDSIANTTAAKGYLAGSLGVTTEWPSTGEGIITTLFIRPDGQSDQIVLSTPNTKKSDFHSGTDRGQIFVTALPEGRYEINQVIFRGTNGRKTVRSKSNNNLGIFFNVSADKVTYIGQFITSSLVANSQLWNTLYPSGLAIVHHSYAAERDQPLITERFPAIATLTFDEANLEGYEENKLASKVIEK
ncbi:hypothetical protein ACQKPX_13725 [Photobacterium sp. DNB23_23_1]|uniref:DUF4382 domain-containing protein n=1 Tax=Photobacterium pectinilyticum TaxID=2906793 RepID=A0ABT1N653_9GAMM|nr:hypothetical protein [Photobacterium sp. ZSDE20]MCQ1060210.1 hypothetical protein [Photobacterium sp. ZSDE20]MDD1827511.1 hypothetical protein [Photobacterium sp. ZSDE20]